MTGIVASVGRGGVNHVADVRLLQGLLNPKIRQLRLPALKVDGSCGPLTITAIERYQRFVLGMTPAPGRIDPNSRTLASLAPLSAASIGPAYATAPDGRPLTGGEIRLLQSVFGHHIRYSEVLIFSRRWSWPFPKDRAMAPNGNVYFPGADYKPDFSAGNVVLSSKALFVHEATHLYQWYGLGQIVWARGPFDRSYDYTLERGKRYRDYGLEHMGMIAQHYFVLRSGGVVDDDFPYSLRDYAHLLPVK